jgi:pimeloyl-ACP methyl ester carboxylesterase
MLVEWARTLSRLGAWVLRFDYRGHGDSAAAFHDCVVEDFISDISMAIAELEIRSGTPCRGLCGLRLGATLATLTAAREGRRLFLILWEPIVSGQAYLDELLRGVIAKDMALKTERRRTRSDLKKRIASGGQVINEGRRITKALASSLEDVNLLDAYTANSASTLIVQIDRRPPASPRKELESLLNQMNTRFPTDLKMIGGPPLWFGSLVQHYEDRVRPVALFRETLQWMRESIALSGAESRAFPDGGCDRPLNGTDSTSRKGTDTRSGVIPSTCESYVSDTSAHERAVSFRVDGLQCTGVLHVPSDNDPRRPFLLMLPQGMNLRTGWNRLHVKLARYLGRRGWGSLRFDARGLGNSEGTLDMPTGADVFHAVETGAHLNDTATAIGFAQRTVRARSFVLLGLCGGAVTACLAAAEDERVAGIALLELPLTYSRHPTQRDAQPIWRYREKVFSLAAWQRALRLQIDFRLHLRSLLRGLGRCASVKRHAAAENEWLTDRLGPSANTSLVSAMKRCCDRGIPTLCVFGSTDNQEYFNRVKPIGFLKQAAARRVLSQCSIEGADHDFLLPQHSQELARRVHDWLVRCFGASRNSSRRPA